MAWILDGERIQATYMGHTVTGVVESSRIKYGGRIQYTVNLDQAIKFRWSTEPTTLVLINPDQIIDPANQLESA
jgi:hypothetical protein